jgi:hypothetical protein
MLSNIFNDRFILFGKAWSLNLIAI